jgi:hypothetical protein
MSLMKIAVVEAILDVRVLMKFCSYFLQPPGHEAGPLPPILWFSKDTYKKITGV